MQERLKSLGGTLEIVNRGDGRGVVVSAHLPTRGAFVSGRGHARQEVTLQ
ncbi:MAG: hypothetical protein WDN31_22045 [Hyphomicrobium sp.]